MSIQAALDRLQTVNPLAALLICDIEEGEPSYFGYVAINGAWMIKQYSEAAGTMRYALGINDYANNWSNRASLLYTLPDYKE